MDPSEDWDYVYYIKRQIDIGLEEGLLIDDILQRYIGFKYYECQNCNIIEITVLRDLIKFYEGKKEDKFVGVDHGHHMNSGVVMSPDFWMALPEPPAQPPTEQEVEL
jgi:hypothetical protein